MTSTTRFIFASTAAAASLIVAARAQAQSCTADKDCLQGFACVQSGEINGGSTPACPPDATDCPKPAPAPAPTPVYSCQPKTCAFDTDCGTGMVCNTETSTACSGGSTVAPCPANTDCPTPVKTDPTCTTTTRSICAFKWQLPCQNDAACGTGFTCYPIVIGMCSGSGGTGSAGSASTGSATAGGSTDGGSTASTPNQPAPPVAAGDASASPDSQCTTMSSYPGYCQPTVTTCAADSDCPGGWTCQEAPQPVSAGGALSGTTKAEPAPAPTSGDAGAPTDPTTPPSTGGGTTSKLCAPPYGLGVPRDATAGHGETASTPGTTAGGSGSGDGNGGPSTGATPPASSGGNGTTAGAGSSGGCSIDPSSEAARTGGLALFTLLGLLAVRRMRRI